MPSTRRSGLTRTMACGRTCRAPRTAGSIRVQPRHAARSGSRSQAGPRLTRFRTSARRLNVSAKCLRYFNCFEFERLLAVLGQPEQSDFVRPAVNGPLRSRGLEGQIYGNLDGGARVSRMEVHL